MIQAVLCVCVCVCWTFFKWIKVNVSFMTHTNTVLSDLVSVQKRKWRLFSSPETSYSACWLTLISAPNSLIQSSERPPSAPPSLCDDSHVPFLLADFCDKDKSLTHVQVRREWDTQPPRAQPRAAVSLITEDVLEAPLCVWDKSFRTSALPNPDELQNVFLNSATGKKHFYPTV